MKNLKNITTAILAVAFFTTAATAQTTAAVKVKAVPTVTVADEPLTVKYIGNQDDYLYFQVDIAAANSNFTMLKISDKTEGELYSQSWKSGIKTQTFKIEKKAEGQELNFKLVAGDKVYSKTFSSTTSLKETTTVNENDMVVL